MILLRAADAAWPAQAAAESQVWQDLLTDDLITCHHIGSTSVPGLIAKPILDLMPEVRSHAVFDRMHTAIADAGYEARGPFGLPGRRYFVKDDAAGARLVKVHAYVTGDPSLTRHLAFHDLLRDDPQVRDAYAQIKRNADQVAQGDISTYMDLKDAFIKTHEAVALTRAR